MSSSVAAHIDVFAPNASRTIIRTSSSDAAVIRTGIDPRTGEQLLAGDMREALLREAKACPALVALWLRAQTALLLASDARVKPAANPLLAIVDGRMHTVGVDEVDGARLVEEFWEGTGVTEDAYLIERGRASLEGRTRSLVQLDVAGEVTLVAEEGDVPEAEAAMKRHTRGCHLIHVVTPDAALKGRTAVSAREEMVMDVAHETADLRRGLSIPAGATDVVRFWVDRLMHLRMDPVAFAELQARRTCSVQPPNGEAKRNKDLIDRLKQHAPVYLADDAAEPWKHRGEPSKSKRN